MNAEITTPIRRTGCGDYPALAGTETSMDTRELTARNADIVRRRLAGESATDLAREYGVAVSRISQLVRRSKERAGETPQDSRHEPSPGASEVRPRLRKVELGLWECADGAVSRRGETPKEAYDRWMLAAISAELNGHSRAMVAIEEESEQPYRGPVTVIPGMRPGNPLKLPTALLLNGARARAAQPYTPSLSGGRRGGE